MGREASRTVNVSIRRALASARSRDSRYARHVRLPRRRGPRAGAVGAGGEGRGRLSAGCPVAWHGQCGCVPYGCRMPGRGGARRAPCGGRWSLLHCGAVVVARPHNQAVPGVSPGGALLHSGHERGEGLVRDARGHVEEHLLFYRHLLPRGAMGGASAGRGGGRAISRGISAHQREHERVGDEPVGRARLPHRHEARGQLRRGRRGLGSRVCGLAAASGGCERASAPCW